MSTTLAWVQHTFLRSRLILTLGATVDMLDENVSEEQRAQMFAQSLFLDAMERTNTTSLTAAAQAWRQGWSGPETENGEALWPLIEPYRRLSFWRPRPTFPDEADMRQLCNQVSEMFAALTDGAGDTAEATPQLREGASALLRLYALASLHLGDSEPAWHRFLEKSPRASSGPS